MGVYLRKINMAPRAALQKWRRQRRITERTIGFLSHSITSLQIFRLNSQDKLASSKQKRAGSMVSQFKKLRLPDEIRMA